MLMPLQNSSRAATRPRAAGRRSGRRAVLHGLGQYIQNPSWLPAGTGLNYTLAQLNQMFPYVGSDFIQSYTSMSGVTADTLGYFSRINAASSLNPGPSVGAWAWSGTNDATIGTAVNQAVQSAGPQAASTAALNSVAQIYGASAVQAPAGPQPTTSTAASTSTSSPTAAAATSAASTVSSSSSSGEAGAYIPGMAPQAPPDNSLQSQAVYAGQLASEEQMNPGLVTSSLASSAAASSAVNLAPGATAYPVMYLPATGTTSTSWFTDPAQELINGVENWMLVAGAGILLFMFMGRRR